MVSWNNKQKRNTRKKNKTRAIKNTCNPTWSDAGTSTDDEVFELLTSDSLDEYEGETSYGTLEIRVLDDDGFFDQDDFLGHAKLEGDALQMALRGKGEQSFPLVADASRSSGYNKYVDDHSGQAELVVRFEIEDIREYIRRKVLRSYL